ncbi:MAG: DUF1830 domain-containing protein [Cyanobacteria bacterium]|jgi:hypothetical protein|nr:DUF1830 domain-containing protein [Cyanobacteria bacterium GSL.Bin1]
MTTIASQPLENKKTMLLCHFFNNRNQVIIARISNIPNWYLEKVVFPAQRFLFEAPEEAVLEIHSPNQGTIREDTISCRELCIDEC